MSTEQPSFIEALRKLHGDQLTPFHIRVQLWMLLFGPGNLHLKLRNLFTQSYSPWNLREGAIAILRESLFSLAAKLEQIDIPLEVVRMALQAKMKAEKREKGFHIGLIADGNRRYGVLEGEKHGILEDQRKSWGHIQGAKAIQETFLPLVAQIPEISECSLYLLSDDNLYNRGEKELEKLDQLFANEKRNLLALAQKNNIRCHHAGNMQELESKMPGMAQGLKELVEETKGNNGLAVNLCINYQAKTEVGHAAKEWAVQKIREGATEEEIMAIPNKEVTESLRKEAWIQEKMDLCIRTGGDQRASGFPPNLPWNENCQLSVLKKFLPQIDAQDIIRALYEFAEAELRKGR